MLNEELEMKWKAWFNHDEHFFKKRQDRTQANAVSYYFILDCFENKLVYKSDSVSEILGYDVEEFTLLKLLSIIHPDDVDYCLSCESYTLTFMDKLYFSDHFRYHTSYSYRVKTIDGSYIFIKQSYQALEVNGRGHMSKSLIFHELMPADYERPNNDFQVVDRSKNRTVNINNIFDLTKREQQILELILDAHSSSEIANKLFLSINTVNTHRKNILQKTNCVSFMELLQKINNQ